MTDAQRSDFFKRIAFHLLKKFFADAGSLVEDAEGECDAIVIFWPVVDFITITIS